MATARIKKEIAQCMAPDSPVKFQKVEMIGDTITHLKGSFKGPEGTPYDGGVFEVDIQSERIVMEIERDYIASFLMRFLIVPTDEMYVFHRFLFPFIHRILCEIATRPPTVITKVYHPNVSSQTGAICLDILKDQWSPVLTLKTALISLQSLMSDPAADNPQDAMVAKHYLSNRSGFDETARQWTRQYAGAPTSSTTDADFIDPSVDRAALQRLCDMGFDKMQAAQALKKFNGNETRAVEALLG
ncbi:ubiquitin-conjugating enzyme E2 K [Entophlyctis sp. JEL0112]|nr:ubiquitin-conjugating enzyme E2 K [Entophlyctis sp. JEL0112]